MLTDDVMDRYRRLRAISNEQHHAAEACVAASSRLERARELGITRSGQYIVAESPQEMLLVEDLALYTAKPGRSRAIDRYARAAMPGLEGEEAQVLAAMQSARFSFWQVEGRHDVAGLRLTDLIGGGETWLVDAAFTKVAQPGWLVAARLQWPADFAIFCKVMVPVGLDIVQDLMADGLKWFRTGTREQVAADPRFATSVYRAAVRAGAMERVRFQDLPPAERAPAESLA